MGASRRPTRAEAEKARRRGFREPPRVTLRRAVSTAAAGEAGERGFFARLAGRLREAGAGISLLSNGHRALVRLGVGAQVDALAARMAPGGEGLRTRAGITATP